MLLLSRNPQLLALPLIVILAILSITLKNLPIGGWLLFFCGHIYIVVITSLILTVLNNRVFLTLHQMGPERYMALLAARLPLLGTGVVAAVAANIASDSLGLGRCNSSEVHTYGARFGRCASDTRRFEIFPDGCSAANGRSSGV